MSTFSIRHFPIIFKRSPTAKESEHGVVTCQRVRNRLMVQRNNNALQVLKLHYQFVTSYTLFTLIYFLQRKHQCNFVKFKKYILYFIIEEKNIRQFQESNPSPLNCVQDVYPFRFTTYSKYFNFFYTYVKAVEPVSIPAKTNILLNY